MIEDKEDEENKEDKEGKVMIRIRLLMFYSFIVLKWIMKNE
jgi:hypothetical protein